MKKIEIILVLLILSQMAFSQKAITVEKTGNGKPILFLPGFTVPGSVWNETIQNLNGSWECHTVSYAGFNGTAPIDTPWYEPIRTQLIQYIQKEGLSNLTVIGHSMGGNLAVELASELPDQVTGLILIESLPCMLELVMPGVPASNIHYNSPYNNQILAMSPDEFREMVTKMCQSITSQKEKDDLLVNWSLQADRKTYVYGYTELLKLDLRDKLNQINLQTLILGGSFPSAEIERVNLEKQYVNLKNKEILNIEGSKHFIMFDQPVWLYAQINKYLSQHVR